MSVDDDTPQSQALQTHLADAFSHDPRPLRGDAECDWSRCDRAVAYAVPSHGGMGGDDRVCRYHTAVYRDRHPETWASLVDVDPRARWIPDAGDRFTTWSAMPATRSVDGRDVEPVALTNTGLAIYETIETSESATVHYYSLTVDGQRGHISFPADADRIEAFISWVRTEHGLRDVGGRWAEALPESPCSLITFHGGDA